MNGAYNIACVFGALITFFVLWAIPEYRVLSYAIPLMLAISLAVTLLNYSRYVSLKRRNTEVERLEGGYRGRNRRAY